MVLATWISQQVVFDGLVQGVVYGLLAMAIVLVYRSTKVINFAVANMGLVGAGLLVICDVNYGFPFWVAVVLALVVGVAYGAAIELVVIRRLFTAPRVIVLVATIGVAQLSLAILTAYPDLVGEGKPFPQAITSSWHLGGVRIKGSQLLVLVVGPLVAIGLGWFLNRTLLGRTVRAAAGNPDLARLHGISPKLMSTLVWALGGLLATVSLILIGGVGGSAGTLDSLGPNTLLRALIAAVIARLTSFRTALLAAIGIGIGESLVRFNFLLQPGLVEVLLLVVVLVAVGLQSRTAGPEESPFAFTPRVQPLPERLRPRFWVRHLDRLALLVLLGAAVVLPLLVTQPSRQLLYATMAAWAICALSLTVLTGWAGQLSLGQMAFAGVGAFTAAALARGFRLDWRLGGTHLLNVALVPVPFALAVLVGAVVAALLSVLIGAGALRVRGLLLAVTTFALAIAADTWLYRLDVFSGGRTNTAAFPRGPPARPRPAEPAHLLLRGAGRARGGHRPPRPAAPVRCRPGHHRDPRQRRLGRRLHGPARVRQAPGLRPRRVRRRSRRRPARRRAPADPPRELAVRRAGVAHPGRHHRHRRHGLHRRRGHRRRLDHRPAGAVPRQRARAAAVVEHRPARVAALLPRRVRADRLRRPWRPLPLARAQAASGHQGGGRPAGGPPLRAPTGARARRGAADRGRHGDLRRGAGRRRGLHRGPQRGGRRAHRHQRRGQVHPHERHRRIRPRHRLGRAARPRRHRHLRRPPCPAGLGRTFQAATLFPELTVRETVQVALEARGRTGLLATALFWPPATHRERTRRAESAELIDFLGLGRYADVPIADLSTGTRRIVELAGLLALDAKVLCLDEPTAGVAQREAEAMGPLLVEIGRELGASMLVIEHDMPLIMGMSDRVYCLEVGRVIAEGDPTTVRHDPAVVASYLGTDERTIARSGAAPTDTTRASV